MLSKRSGRVFETDNYVVLSFADNIPSAHSLLTFVVRKVSGGTDGGQHAENVAADHKRSRFLEEQGYRVLRFWNHDVLKDTVAVLERIAEALNDPHPCPLPGKGEGEEENPVKPNR